MPFALAWVWWVNAGRKLAWVAAGVALLLTPWVIRTWRVVGEPILYSNGGFSLWTANHRLTFDYFPVTSIDEAAGPEWDDLTAAEQSEFNAIHDPQGIRQTQWYWRKGLAFIEQHPVLTGKRAVAKIGIAFSPVFSPRKDRLFQAVYFLWYFPVLVLAPVGAWRSRRQWRDLGYFYCLIASFALCSAIFWAHTSHRMYLEPYLMILAARAIMPDAYTCAGEFGQKL